MKHFPWRECGWAALFLLVLAVVYAGSYYAMVYPLPTPAPPYAAGYRFGDDWAARAYWPMERLDRVLRRDFWHEWR